MDKIIGILKEQCEKEIKSIEEKGLTTNNLDVLHKLTSTIHCLEKESVPAVMVEAADSVIKKYSNGRYDHNIDALYDAYIEAKKKYKEVGDQGHRDKLMECVGRLMTEVYDMLSSLVLDADFREEREEVVRQIRRLAEA